MLDSLHQNGAGVAQAGFRLDGSSEGGEVPFIEGEGAGVVLERCLQVAGAIPGQAQVEIGSGVVGGACRCGIECFGGFHQSPLAQQQHAEVVPCGGEVRILFDSLMIEVDRVCGVFGALGRDGETLGGCDPLAFVGERDDGDVALGG